MNEITHEMINIDKFYYMKTINSTAEGYFCSCRFPCAGQFVLELQALSVTTDMGTLELHVEMKTFAKHLSKTHMYKQQAKHDLLLKSLVHVHYCELEIPVTINSTCLMNAINNILNGVCCYYIIAT